MRLHPVKDGVVPFDPADRRPVTTRDMYGQPLTDVHDGNGFCTGTRSNMVSLDGAPVIVPSGVGGSPTEACPNIQTTVAPNGALVYYDPSKVIVTDDGSTWALVMRTTTDGDKPLPASRVKVAERPSDADEAVKSAIKLMGFKGRVTPGMRRAILDMIALEVSHVSGTDKR